MLLARDIQCNAHSGIIEEFDKHFVKKGEIKGIEDFKDLVLQINKYEPSEDFANSYLSQASGFFDQVTELKNQPEKVVVNEFYKA